MLGKGRMTDPFTQAFVFSRSLIVRNGFVTAKEVLRMYVRSYVR